MKYDLDLNGILALKAVEKDTGRKLNAVINNVFSEISQERVQQSKEKMQALERPEDTVRDSEVGDESPATEDIEITRTLELATEKLSSAHPGGKGSGKSTGAFRMRQDWLSQIGQKKTTPRIRSETDVRFDGLDGMRKRDRVISHPVVIPGG